MICVPLDDIEDVIQRHLDRIARDSAGYAVVALARAELLCLVDELTSLQVDTDALACRECGEQYDIFVYHGGIYCHNCFWDAEDCLVGS